MRQLSFQQSFTFLEVVAVLILLGIASAIAASRLTDTGHELSAETSVVRTHLRFAKSLSMASDIDQWGIDFSSSSYTLTRNGVQAVKVNLPGHDSAVHAFDSVRITSGAGGVTFNSLGSPGASDRALVLDGSADVTVTANTGFVQ